MEWLSWFLEFFKVNLRCQLEYFPICRLCGRIFFPSSFRLLTELGFVLISSSGNYWHSLVHGPTQSQKRQRIRFLTLPPTLFCSFSDSLPFFFPTFEGSWEGNGNPLQCSCLENPRDGGAWWTVVSGVTQSRTWLKRLSSSSDYIRASQVVLVVKNPPANAGKL